MRRRPPAIRSRIAIDRLAEALDGQLERTRTAQPAAGDQRGEIPTGAQEMGRAPDEAPVRQQLYFWRLAFYPTYRMGQVKTALHRILNDQGVKSAVAY